jgi:hypothetical protein
MMDAVSSMQMLFSRTPREQHPSAADTGGYKEERERERKGIIISNALASSTSASLRRALPSP